MIDVYLMGSLPTMVLIEQATGVRYGHQYDGFATNQFHAEGFIVPVDGDVPDWPANIAPDPGTVKALRLAVWIDEIKLLIWPDETRWTDAAEALVPVTAGDYVGWLIWENSD